MENQETENPESQFQTNEAALSPEGRIQSVLCATDFSETADLALRHAIALARQHDARLIVAHVVEPIPVDPYPLPMAFPDGDAELRRIAEARVAELVTSIRGEGISVESLVEMGATGARIVECAKRVSPDLIIIGTRGLTGFKHLLLGSTAEYVVRRAPCPVLTVHPEDRKMIDEARVVLMPTDLSTDADAAADAFLELFSFKHVPRVELVFADATPPYLEAMSHERLTRYQQPDTRREDIETQLAPLTRRLAKAGFDVTTHVLDGGPVESITELAEKQGADLIALSTHGRSAIMNALLGRTAQRIVNHAPCPVLSVCPERRRR